MKKYVFYFHEHIGGNAYYEVIEAKTFVIARNIFFEKHQHTPHRVDFVHEFLNDDLVRTYK